MKTSKSKQLFLLLFFITAAAFSQIKKLDKTFTTNKDVRVKIDAKHTNVIVEHWDRNEVKIEALLESGDLDKEETQKLMNSWKLETSGSADEVTIVSGGGSPWHGDFERPHFEESMIHFQHKIGPLMTDLVGPVLENLAKNPLPPEFYAKMGNLNFDYEAYKRDGDKYLERWEKKVEQTFGKDFEKSMEEWAAQFEKNASKRDEKSKAEAEEWEKNFEKEMEKWGESFGAEMEKWGESLGAEMEKWGEQFEKNMESKEHASGADMRNLKKSAKANRSIRLKVPEGAKLNMEVRHGEVKLGQRTTNLKANLTHSRLSGNIIDGKSTEVKASYTPINISQWNYGILNTSYVKDCRINSARSIKLTSNSSDVHINEIQETGILSGSFGKLQIDKLNPDFKNLDISLENSELKLSLPDTALNFNYNGSQSKIEYPKTSTVKATRSYDNEILNGYFKNRGGNSQLSIKAKFSDVTIK